MVGSAGSKSDLTLINVHACLVNHKVDFGDAALSAAARELLTADLRCPQQAGKIGFDFHI